MNVVTGRGRHTSTSAVALRLPQGGWVVDTPGIRSFGLAHVDLDRFMHAFPDLEPGTEECPRGCGHDDEHCALDRWVADGHADPERLVVAAPAARESGSHRRRPVERRRQPPEVELATPPQTDSAPECPTRTIHAVAARATTTDTTPTVSVIPRP